MGDIDEESSHTIVSIKVHGDGVNNLSAFLHKEK